MKSLSCNALRVLPLVLILIVGCSGNGSGNAAEIKLSYDKVGPQFKGEISAKGLKKLKSYVLCVNGKVGQAGNNQLLRYGNWGGEGYHDFMEVETDNEGRFSSKFVVELQVGEYDVTFLLKDVSDKYKPIFVKNHVQFTIKK